MPGEADKSNASGAEAIFIAALELPPAERPAYLDASCGDDQKLRQRVEALLRAHEAPEGFLPENPGSPPPAAQLPSYASLLAAQLSEKPGDTIGHYKLLEKIGEGGCGVVYMAEQEVPVRRKVALKVIKLGMDTRSVIARFEAERQALALMDHSNIAKVLDAGATDTGRPYFVMELVGGIKITEFCDRNRLSMRQRLDLFIQVCRAIQHAHQKGIIHRDIKPSNVLVAEQDGVPVPKVIDFGIAKATEGKLTDQTVFTAFEHFLGTPAYMSPEQAQLGGLDVDTRSDIYSLGVLLYELLTGKTPFDTQDMVASGLDEMRRTIREKEPSRPSTRLKTMALGELNTAANRRQVDAPKLLHLLRGDLDWIVMKCLQKDRSRRYETANGLAHDIERHLNNEPIVARPPSRLYEFQKTVRRHKFGFAATAAVIVALSAGIVATSLEAVRARRLEHEAQTARHDATDRLWASYLAEAHALRVSGQAGRHFESLATIKKAAAIRPSLELRNEAIASMVLPDIRWVGRKDFSKTREPMRPDPTFERYALCDKRGTVSVRRAADDREEAGLPGVGVAATSVGEFSPNGKFLVVPYADQHWRVWDWSKAVTVLESEFVKGYGFGPDNRTFAISDTTNIVLHDLVGGKRRNNISLGSLCSPSSPGNFLFDPTGQRLALLHTEAHTNVAIVDTRTGQTLKTLQHPAHVWSVTWHPDARHLATGCDDHTIRIWDSSSGERLRMWRAESVSVSFNHRGDVLASSGWDGYTRLWEFDGGRELISIYKSGGILGFSPDNLRLATGGWDGKTVDFFDVAPRQALRTVYEASEAHGSAGGWPLIDGSGRLLAFRTQEGLALFDLRTAQQVCSARLELDQGVVGFDEDAQNLIMIGPKGLFRCPISKANDRGLFSIGDAILVNPECALPSIGWISANGRICAIEHNYDGREDIRCQIFRMDTFTKQAETGVQPGMRYGALSPDGSFFASAAWHHAGVNVWDTQTGALIKRLHVELEHEEAATTTVAFSPSGKHLVAATMDEYLFWEVGSWSLVRRIPQGPDNDFVPMMAFSRDGRILAGTHSRNKIRLHDSATGQVLADLEAPSAKEITGLCFNQDGTQLVSCESWDSVRLWDLRRIRRQLDELGLDWNQPPYPANDSGLANSYDQSPVTPGR
jgi:serine/threonine protein kinase/WD40 repeat protein